jgi:hypothetical protein
MQFLLEGRRVGEPGLYVLSETAEELHHVAASHGWSLDGIEMFQLPPDWRGGRRRVHALSPRGDRAGGPYEKGGATCTDHQADARRLRRAVGIQAPRQGSPAAPPPDSRTQGFLSAEAVDRVAARRSLGRDRPICSCGAWRTESYTSNTFRSSTNGQTAATNRQNRFAR